MLKYKHLQEELRDFGKKVVRLSRYNLTRGKHNVSGDLYKSIKSSLNKYYNKLRDYQLEIDLLVKNITENIKGTINESLYNNNDINNYNNLLELYKDNKKILSILSKITDKLNKKTINVEDISKNNCNLIKNNTKIGFLKIQTKKILLFIQKYNMTLEFNLVDNDDTLKILDSIL